MSAPADAVRRCCVLLLIGPAALLAQPAPASPEPSAPAPVSVAPGAETPASNAPPAAAMPPALPAPAPAVTEAPTQPAGAAPPAVEKVPPPSPAPAPAAEPALQSTPPEAPAAAAPAGTEKPPMESPATPVPDAAAAPAESAAAPASPEAAPPAAAVPPKPVDPRLDTGPIVRPPVRAGDVWVYRRGNGKSSTLMSQRAEKVSDDGIALRTQQEGSPDSKTVLYDREWGLVASGFNDYLPALRYYAFPLYAGKRWSIDSAVSNFGAGETGRVKGEAHAAGWENIEVPAGKYLALRIELDFETADPGDASRTIRVRETHWYARTVLRPVKVESRSVVADQEPVTDVVELVGYRMQ